MSVESKNFYHVDQSPANAVALARADHVAGEFWNCEFVSALNVAEAQLRAFPDLVIAAARLLAYVDVSTIRPGVKHEREWDERANAVRDALRAARGY